MTAVAPEEPLALRTYRTLRRGIILGRYPQGSPMVEAALASELNVSRLPIREAGPQLENEGFVIALPRRTSRVREWTAAGVIELYDARLSLETLAARLAAEAVAAGASLQPMLDALDAEQAALDDADWLAAAETSTLLHEAIVDVGGSELLGSLMRGISGRMTWLAYLTSTRDRGEQSHEHHGILDAIRTGNPRLAEAVVAAHIERGRAPSLAMLARA